MCEFTRRTAVRHARPVAVAGGERDEFLLGVVGHLEHDMGQLELAEKRVAQALGASRIHASRGG